MEHRSPIILLEPFPKIPLPTQKEEAESLSLLWISTIYPFSFFFLTVLVCYKPWLFIHAFQMLKHVFVYIFPKEISMRNSININNWIFDMSTETFYLFSRKSMFHVIYSNCFKWKGPIKKIIFNYEKWKGYMLSKLSLLSPHQNHLWP